MADEEQKRGGPKTPEGKAVSSQNARTHGVRSKVLILPEESQEDYDAVSEGWRRQFKPADYQEDVLVDALILNDWMLKRSVRRDIMGERDQTFKLQMQVIKSEQKLAKLGIKPEETPASEPQPVGPAEGEKAGKGFGSGRPEDAGRNVRSGAVTVFRAKQKEQRVGR